MLEPRTLERKGAEQGAKRASAMSLELERRAAIQARHMRIKKGADLLLEEALLEGTEEVFGLSQSQPEMLDALVVLGEGKDIGDGFFLTVIVTDDELQFDAHSRASPGSSGRGRIRVILFDLVDFPQHFPALMAVQDPHRAVRYHSRLGFISQQQDLLA